MCNGYVTLSHKQIFNNVDYDSALITNIQQLCDMMLILSHSNIHFSFRNGISPANKYFMLRDIILTSVFLSPTHKHFIM